jgi:hypothetical protein
VRTFPVVCMCVCVCVCSGKTTELMRRLKRFMVAQHKCLVRRILEFLSGRPSRAERQTTSGSVVACVRVCVCVCVSENVCS